MAWIRRYIVFHGKRHPAEMGAVEITQFLSSLAIHRDLSTTMIYTHVLNRRPAGVRSPADLMGL